MDWRAGRTGGRPREQSGAQQGIKWRVMKQMEEEPRAARQLDTGRAPEQRGAGGVRLRKRQTGRPPDEAQMSARAICAARLHWSARSRRALISATISSGMRSCAHANDRPLAPVAPLAARWPAFSRRLAAGRSGARQRLYSGAGAYRRRTGAQAGPSGPKWARAKQ